MSEQHSMSGRGGQSVPHWTWMLHIRYFHLSSKFLSCHFTQTCTVTVISCILHQKKKLPLIKGGMIFSFLTEMASFICASHFCLYISFISWELQFVVLTEHFGLKIYGIHHIWCLHCLILSRCIFSCLRIKVTGMLYAIGNYRTVTQCGTRPPTHCG